jgi:hypothetical protein
MIGTLLANDLGMGPERFLSSSLIVRETISVGHYSSPPQVRAFNNIMGLWGKCTDHFGVNVPEHMQSTPVSHCRIITVPKGTPTSKWMQLHTHCSHGTYFSYVRTMQGGIPALEHSINQANKQTNLIILWAGTVVRTNTGVKEPRPLKQTLQTIQYEDCHGHIKREAYKTHHSNSCPERPENWDENLP